MTSTYSTLDAQINAIETEISRLRAQARELRVRRNALGAFSRLPAEVVHYILDILLHGTLLEEYLDPDGQRSDHKTWYAPRKRIEWTNVLGVCTFLRDLAIAYPALWSYVDLNRSYLWVDTCAERSRGHPLRITYSGPADESKDDLLRYLMDRACDARIYTTSKSGNPFMTSVLNGPHPYLRSLTYAPKREIRLGWARLELTPGFLGTTSATITRLALSNVDLMAKIPLLPALQHLECSRLGTHQPEWIFGLIRGAPRLTHLRLIEPQHVIENNRLHFEPVHLPDLVYTELSAGLDWISTFLAAVSAPRSTYTVSVPIDSPHVDLHTATALRSHISDIIFALLNSIEGANFPPRIYLSDHEKYDVMKIRVETHGGQLDFQYEDYSSTHESLHPILRHAEALQVEGECVDVFAHALACLVDPLASVDEIVLKSIGEVGDLAQWLQSRADAQHTVRSLEFRQCQDAFGTRAVYEAYVRDLLNRELLVSAWSEDVYE
jgi:hypothetical protein